MAGAERPRRDDVKIVLATRNPDKVSEIREILRGLDLELVEVSAFPRVGEVEETGKTLEENAVLKARAVAGAVGLPALADDSGLEADALEGAPGVRSSRFAGEDATYRDNWELLLRRLEGVPRERRGARFRCVIALCLTENGRERLLLSEGILPGEILESPRGRRGFGYDPVFYVPAAGKTLAEMEDEEKNRTSHRYRALVEMKYLLLREPGIEETARGEGA
jgi:XTP/dITP diphosphohydrolase